MIFGRSYAGPYSDQTRPFMCPADLNESTAICSDTPKTDDNSLIFEPTGNTMIRFAIQDENEHTPVITVEKDNDGNQKTLRILERIGHDFTEPLEIRFSYSEFFKTQIFQSS